MVIWCRAARPALLALALVGLARPEAEKRHRHLALGKGQQLRVIRRPDRAGAVAAAVLRLLLLRRRLQAAVVQRAHPAPRRQAPAVRAEHSQIAVIHRRQRELRVAGGRASDFGEVRASEAICGAVCRS